LNIKFLRFWKHHNSRCWCEHVEFLFVVHVAHGEHLLQTSRFHNIFTANFKNHLFKSTRCSFIHIYNWSSPSSFSIFSVHTVNPLQNTSLHPHRYRHEFPSSHFSILVFGSTWIWFLPPPAIFPLPLPVAFWPFQSYRITIIGYFFFNISHDHHVFIAFQLMLSKFYTLIQFT
jgi:hypothetical protein